MADSTPEIILEIREFSNEPPPETASRCVSAVFGFDVITTRQRIRLWLGNESRCCEQFGYFWSNDKPDEFIGAQLLGVSLTNDGLYTKQLEAALNNEPCAIEDACTYFVNIDTDRGVLQFTAYNSHNGYYGHAAGVCSEQLTKETML